MKKILFYETSSGFGGSSNALANVVNNLNREKYIPVVACTNFGPQMEAIKNVRLIFVRDKRESESMSHFRFSVFFLVKIVPEAARLFFVMKREKISLVHVNTNLLLGVPAIIAAKTAGLPVICHIRETRPLIKREKIFARFVNKFIVLNKRALELYSQFIPQERIVLVHDGIDVNGFVQGAISPLRQEFNREGMALVGLVGRIVEGKGQKEFVLSAKEVLKVKPQVKFLVVGEAKGGDSSYDKEVRNLVRKERLEENIIFTGWRRDIRDVMTSLDILVQATTTFPEGFGLTCIEAMCLRKPVIATDVPGPSDIVLDGKTGFLVPPGNIRAMAEKILYLLDNRDIAATMGEKGRLRVEELFDIRKQVKKIEDLYEGILSTGLA